MAILFVSAVTLVSAQSGNSGKNADKKENSQSEQSNNRGKNENKKSETSEVDNSGPSVNSKRGSVKPNATCDPSLEWKNHGEYVSCVAKLKEGGQTVSEAARSDVGKRGFVASPSASLSPQPSASGSAEPSIEPSPISSESAFPLPTSEPSDEPSVIETITQPITTAVETVQSFFDLLQSLFSF